MDLRNPMLCILWGSWSFMVLDNYAHLLKSPLPMAPDFGLELTVGFNNKPCIFHKQKLSEKCSSSLADSHGWGSFFFWGCLDAIGKKCEKQTLVYTLRSWCDSQSNPVVDVLYRDECHRFVELIFRSFTSRPSFLHFCSFINSADTMEASLCTL